MTITQLGQKFIEDQIITGTNVGDKVFIPRIIMSPNDVKWPFRLKRRQFPLSVCFVCFAMTINKSQGKSLPKGWPIFIQIGILPFAIVCYIVQGDKHRWAQNFDRRRWKIR
jgi:hypothetical protein